MPAPGRKLALLMLLLLSPLASCATQSSSDSASSGLVADRVYEAATPWTKLPENDGGMLRFAVIGDRTGFAIPGIFEQAMHQIGWLQPDFIINIGDIIEGYTDDRTVLTAMWDQVEEMVKLSGRPFIFVPGNHDLGNGVMLDVWRTRHGAEYYAFTYKGALFIALDSEDPPTPMSAEQAAGFHHIVDALQKDPDATVAAMNKYFADAKKAEEKAKKVGKPLAPDIQKLKEANDHLQVANYSEQQISFLRETLQRHKDVKWTFLFMHKPGWKMRNVNFSQIEDLLKDRPYTFFAGHNHYFTHEIRDGHDYFDMGTTGGISHIAGPGAMDHTILVSLTAQGPKYASIRLNGLMDVDGNTGQTRAR
jgi:hypothetical protein